ncbi:MAG: winged helix-turn-helix domain-containing protein [Ruegeria sp.]
MYSLGRFTLDVSIRELRERQTGAVRHLEPKAFALLTFLVRNADRVVTRDEILEEIWDGRIVSDSVVSTTVRDLRRALDDDGHQQAQIKTIHGHGFRYVGAVETLASNIPKTKKRPVVLHFRPFSRLDGNTSDGFQEGVSEGILTELGRFGALIGLTLEDDGTQDFDLSGSVWVMGQSLRINIQLFDRNQGTHVWAERYDCPIGPTFDELDNTLRAIAATVFGRAAALVQRQALSGNSPDDLIIRGQALYNQVSQTVYTEALPLICELVQDSPDHLRAHALLCAIYDMGGWTGWAEDVGQARERAIFHGRKAIAIDPTDAAARTHLAEALWHAHQCKEAQLQFEQAIQLNPNDVTARALYATFLTSTSRAEDALRELDQCRKLDPFELNWIPWLRADTLFSLERYDDAIEALGEIIHPINNARALLVACYAHIGQIDAARDTLRSFLDTACEEMSNPPKSIEEWERFFSREDPGDGAEALDRLMKGLKAAGLEESFG